MQPPRSTTSAPLAPELVLQAGAVFACACALARHGLAGEAAAICTIAVCALFFAAAPGAGAADDWLICWAAQR